MITSNLIGGGTEAVPGREVTVHRTGWLYDPDGIGNKGRQVECSRADGRAITFQLGGGMIRRAWEEGVVGMRAGGRRTVIVGPAAVSATHGSQGGIPPGTALVYDLELLDVH